MLNRARTKRRRGGGGAARFIAVLGALAFGGVAGCLDLDVPNLTDADRERAAGNPEDVEIFIAGILYPTLWSALHNDSQTSVAWPLSSSQFTATMAGLGTLLFWEEIREPRGLHDNGVILSLGNGPQGARDFWASANEAASIAYDGLRFLDGGIVLMEEEVDVSVRAEAYAKFMQGWAWGSGGLAFDQFHALSEDVDLPTDPNAVVDVAIESLLDYDAVIDAAIASLEEAIDLADANPDIVEYPSFPESQVWFGSPTPISNDKFKRMANTLIARFLVLSARTPDERANDVEWERVLEYTEDGLDAASGDYGFQLNSQRQSQLINRFTNSENGSQNFRWSYYTIGPADQSGAYQDWIAASLDARNRFDIETPDRRITGETPTTRGTYAEYRADDNGFDVNRGTYLFSAYQWRRHALEVGATSETDTADDEGVQHLITVDENNLLRAEAFLRTDEEASAVPLINITRTRTQTIDVTDYPGLEPVTVAGVPEVDDVCVPRLDNGDCGGLYAALRYEIFVENAAMDLVRDLAETRGWGTLADGTPVHWPVPGNALDLYGMSLYTYGGVGNPDSATYGPTPN